MRAPTALSGTRGGSNSGCTAAASASSAVGELFGVEIATGEAERRGIVGEQIAAC